MRSRSTDGCRPRKSTAALKSSVLISGEGTLRGSPLLSPVYDGSRATVTYPRSAIARPEDCSLTAPNGPLMGERRQLPTLAILSCRR